MWEYGYTYPHELYHYGVKGMKWGIRKNKSTLDKSFGSGRMNLQLFANKRKTVRLPRDEYAMVMHEIRTHITADEKRQPVFQRPINNHFYKIENHFDDTYRVIGKRKIPHTMTGLLERIKNDE